MTIALTCDGDECRRVYRGGNGDHLDVDLLRVRAWGDDWDHEGGMDFCPPCANGRIIRRVEP